MKILIVVNNLRVANGVATVIMNQYDSLINNGDKVDFMQFLDFKSPYIERIKRNNGNIFSVKKNYKSIKKMFNILKREKYDILHINQMNLQTVMLIIMARIMNIKCIIYHSHNTKIPGGIKRTFLEKISNIVYKVFAKQFIACSEKAGKDAFGKKEFVVLKNSIDVKKFEYNYKVREKLRQELELKDDAFVVGTVCRFAEQKNPILMIDIVAEVIKRKPNSIFLWIGSASSDKEPIVEKMKERVKELNIEENMLWVGSKEDIYNWYSVMDVFLMPSKWEGLGITYIEAQANSLPTFASDVVPKDTNITEFMHYYSLNLSASEWANEICKYYVRSENSNVDNYNKFIKAGYDLLNAKDDLLKIYNDFLHK